MSVGSEMAGEEADETFGDGLGEEDGELCGFASFTLWSRKKAHNTATIVG